MLIKVLFDNKGLDIDSLLSKKSFFFSPGNKFAAAENPSQHCIDNVNELEAKGEKLKHFHSS